MDATDQDLMTIFTHQHEPLRAMRLAYELGLQDGKFLARIEAEQIPNPHRIGYPMRGIRRLDPLTSPIYRNNGCEPYLYRRSQYVR